ncbi:unnamed protein product [Protopolystoma xenopodis]|uniref:Agenet-like domain-containing protein n=1 Tax=Protopolystoma xenopodis TaxID=117903 RepID=A0A3S4ZC08_9PLAT|nr:unnamed protein product [Protopolystoma xenopodis]
MDIHICLNTGLSYLWRCLVNFCSPEPCFSSFLIPLLFAMEIGIPVEIQGKYGEYYPGFIYSLQSLQTFCVRIFGTNPNSQPAELCVPPSVLRPPADGRSHSNVNPQDLLIGQEVDVLIGGKRGDTSSQSGGLTTASLVFSSWWTGTVSKVRGDFVVVNLNAEDIGSVSAPATEVSTLPDGRVDSPLMRPIEKTEIVEKDQLRLRNLQPNLNPKSFYTHVIDVPDCLVDYFHDPQNFQPLALKCGFPVLVCPAPDGLVATGGGKLDGETYNKASRLVVVSTQPVCIERAALIEKEFIRMSKKKMLLKKQIEEKSERLKSHFVEEFTVQKALLSQAIGIQRCNIHRANAVPGILCVEVDRDSCVFKITGKTRESVKQARALLDYAVEVMQVPKIYVTSLLGHNNRNIQALVDRVGLGRMVVVSASEATVDDCVPFRFTGTRQAIRDARLFLEFNIVSLREIDRIRGHPVPSLTDLMIKIKAISATEEQDYLKNNDDTLSNSKVADRDKVVPVSVSLHRRNRPPPQNQHQIQSHGERTNGAGMDCSGSNQGAASRPISEIDAGGAGDVSNNPAGPNASGTNSYRRKRGVRRGGYGNGPAGLGNTNNNALLHPNGDEPLPPRKSVPSSTDNLGSRPKYSTSDTIDANGNYSRINGHASDQRSDEPGIWNRGRSNLGSANRQKRQPNSKGSFGASINDNTATPFLAPN